jgi:hypothetical protein
VRCHGEKKPSGSPPTSRLSEMPSAASSAQPSRIGVRRRALDHPTTASAPSAEPKKMFTCSASGRTKAALKAVNHSSAHSSARPGRPRPVSPAPALQTA